MLDTQDLGSAPKDMQPRALSPAPRLTQSRQRDEPFEARTRALSSLQNMVGKGEICREGVRLHKIAEHLDVIDKTDP